MSHHLQRAQMLLGQSRYDMALQELEQLLAEAPEHAHAHSLRGYCLVNLERYSEATEAVQTAISLSPEQPHVFYVQSLVCDARNQRKEAEQAITRAIELDPYDADYFAHASVLKVRQQKWQDAINFAEEGLKLDPEHEICTNLRAMALVKLGRKSEAGAAMESSLQREPENPLTHANMGWSKLEQGQPKEAMLHFREALRLDPEMEWARAGIVEAMKGHYFIYRMLLGFFLWINKFDGRTRWMILLGGYFGYRVLVRVASNSPALAPFLLPLIIAYIGFAILTWVGGPIFNFLLWLNPFGRLALSDEEKRTSIWVGSALSLALLLVLGYFFIGENLLLSTALGLALMTPGLTTYYSSDPGWPRAVHGLLLIAMTFFAANTIFGCAGVCFTSDDLKDSFTAITVTTLFPLILTGAFSQFGVHFLVAANPQKGTNAAFWVWVIGGCGIGFGALLVLALDLIVLLTTGR